MSIEPGQSISDTDIPGWTGLSAGAQAEGIFWVHAHQQFYLHAEFRMVRGRLAPVLKCGALG
jgi:hypothetical protein